MQLNTDHTDHYRTGSVSTRHNAWHIKHTKKTKKEKTSNNNVKLDKQSSASDERFLLSTALKVNKHYEIGECNMFFCANSNMIRRRECVILVLVTCDGAQKGQF